MRKTTKQEQDRYMAMKDKERKQAEQKANLQKKQTSKKTSWLKICEHEYAVFPPFLELTYSGYSIELYRCHHCNKIMIAMEHD